MRLIDADALERHFYTKWVNGELSNSEWVDFRQWLKDELTVEPASPWHRVEDDYPDLLQFVVVCNDDGKCVVAQYVGYQADSLTPWRIAYTMYDTDIYDEKECGPVRFWMPLPSPPVNKMFTK